MTVEASFTDGLHHRTGCDVNGLPRIRSVIEPTFRASFLNIVVRSEQGHRHRMQFLPESFKGTDTADTAPRCSSMARGDGEIFSV